MEFKFEYNKTYLPKEYLDNRDDFIKVINKNCVVRPHLDVIMKSTVIDSFYINKDGLVFLNFNENEIIKLVKEWKA